MTTYPLTSLVTILALIVLTVFSGMVSLARGKYKVAAPATTGHPAFDSTYRVHVNTVEQIVTLMPVLWLCAFWIGDSWAGLGGLIWCLGRLIYARGYFRHPEQREIGYYVTVVPVIAMMIAVVVAVAIRLLG
jgi:hypothetical protein